MTAATTEDQGPGPAEAYAQRIAPLLSLAKTAYGSQAPDSPARVASNEVNDLVLEYANAGNKMPALANALQGEISLSGLRRRIRLARATKAAQEGGEAPLGHVKRERGSTDPQDVQQAAALISEAREQGGRVYGDAVRQAYANGIALQPVADTIGISYFSLWNAMRTAY